MTGNELKCIRCGSPDLARAHIIPAAFGRDLIKDEKNFIESTNFDIKKKQTGLFDKNILCRICDAVLGKNDDYAVSVFRRFKGDYEDTFYMPNVDADRIATFIASVLWRSSVSKEAQCSNVALGPYQKIIENAIFGEIHISSVPQFQVILMKYKSKITNPSFLYSLPAKMIGPPVRCYGFGLSGFRIIAKLDKRPFDNILFPIIINGKDHLFGIVGDFDKTLEFRNLVNMIKRSQIRPSTKRR